MEYLHAIAMANFQHSGLLYRMIWENILKDRVIEWRCL